MHVDSSHSQGERFTRKFSSRNKPLYHTNTEYNTVKKSVLFESFDNKENSSRINPFMKKKVMNFQTPGPSRTFKTFTPFVKKEFGQKIEGEFEFFI